MADKIDDRIDEIRKKTLELVGFENMTNVDDFVAGMAGITGALVVVGLARDNGDEDEVRKFVMGAVESSLMDARRHGLVTAFKAGASDFAKLILGIE